MQRKPMEEKPIYPILFSELNPKLTQKLIRIMKASWIYVYTSRADHSLLVAVQAMALLAASVM